MCDLVEVYREPIDDQSLKGFLLARSSHLALIHLLNTALVEMNGFTVVRNKDIRRIKRLNASSFMARALRLKGITPAPLASISVDDWPALLVSANNLFPIVTIHQEAIDNEVCYIGKMILMTDQSYSLKEIDPKARWIRSRRYLFKNLTKVEFGGGYEDALFRLSVEK